MSSAAISGITSAGSTYLFSFYSFMAAQGSNRCSRILPGNQIFHAVAHCTIELKGDTVYRPLGKVYTESGKMPAVYIINFIISFTSTAVGVPKMIMGTNGRAVHSASC